MTDPDAEVWPDRSLEDRVWIASRISWVIMLGIVIAAVFGLTGSGGLFAHQSLEAGRSTIAMPKISRWAAADSLEIEFASGLTGKTVVEIPDEFFEIFSVEDVSPQPSSTVATPNGQKLTFDLSDQTGRHSVRFSIRASTASLPVNVGRFKVAGVVSNQAIVTVLP